MALYAYRLKTSSLALAAGNPIRTPVVSPSNGARGPRFDVTDELRPNLTVDPQSGVAGGLNAAAFASLQAQVASDDFAYEWTGVPEYKTATLRVSSAQADVSDINVEVFADEATGDDANPGTQAQPYKTFQKAWSVVAVPGKMKRRIYLTDEDFPLVGEPTPNDTVLFVPQAMDGGEPLGIYGTPDDSGLGTLVVTGASDFSRNITTAPRGGSPLVGAVVRFTTGDNAGGRLMIQADDLTTLRLCQSPEWIIFNGPVNVLDEFVIETRPTKLSRAPGGPGGRGLVITGGALALKDIEFDVPDRILLNRAALVNMVNVGFVPSNNDGFMAILNSTFAPNAIPFGGYFAPEPFDLFFEGGCNVFIKDTSIDIRNKGVFGQTDFAMSAVLENCFLELRRDALLSMKEGGFAAVGGTYAEVTTSTLEITGNDFAKAEWKGSLAGKSAITARDGAIVQTILADISDADVHGVAGESGSRLFLNDLSGTGNGAGGVGHGVSLQGGTLAVSADDGGTPAVTITGVDGDVLVGTKTVAYADMPFAETELESIGTGAAAAIGATNNVTGLTGMSEENIGDLLAITGSGTPADNDTHLIIRFVSATEVVVASTLTVDAGPLGWTLKSRRPTLNRFTVAA
jgi:hypothetical protein